MIYLLDDGGHPIGPFKNHEEVERFIGMMALCGEDWADHKIVPGGDEEAPAQSPARTDSCADRFQSTRQRKDVEMLPTKPGLQRGR